MTNFLSRLFRLVTKATPITSPQDSRWNIDGLIEHALYGSLTVTPSTALSFYRQSSAIATAVDLIASKIETITPVIERNGEIQERDEVTQFLARPNGFSLWRRFIGSAARDTLLTGNCYFLGLGTVTRPPLEVYNAHPLEVAPFITGTDGFPDTYSVHGQLAPGQYLRQPRPGGGVRFLDGPLREIYHHRGYSTRSNAMTGDSPIESILLEIRQHIAGRQHNEAMLRQGGRLSLLFLIKESLPDILFKPLAARNREEFSGPSNAGKVATIAAKDVDIKEFGVSNKDMDYVNLDEITKAAIFSRYNIPLPLITSSRQTLNNYGTAIEALYDEAVLPLADILFEALTDFLLPRYGRDPRTERITYDPQSITALNDRRIRQLKDESTIGVLTMNEIREKMPNIGPINGGDIVFISATQVPGAGDGIDLAVEHQDDRAATEEARGRLAEQMAAGNDPDDGGDDPDAGADNPDEDEET